MLLLEAVLPSTVFSDLALTLRREATRKQKIRRNVCACLHSYIHVLVCSCWALYVHTCMIRGKTQICSVAFHPERGTLPQYITTTGDGERESPSNDAMRAGLLLLPTLSVQPVTPVTRFRWREKKGKRKKGSGRLADISAVRSACTVLTVHMSFLAHRKTCQGLDCGLRNPCR